jgi:hypothetical protein
MTFISNVRFLFIAALFCVHSASGQEHRGLDVSVKAAIEEGQIVNGHYNIIDNSYRYMTRSIPYRLWLNRSYINVRLQSVLSDRLIVTAEPEVRVWFNTYPSVMIQGAHTFTPFRQYAYAAIAEGQGVYSFRGNDDPSLRLGIGIFPIKYNPDAVNLGEYLFRSGAYVPYLINRFEYQFGKLTGFHLSSDLFGWLKQDLMLHSETQIQPLHNWSLSYLMEIKKNAFDLGAGASLHHWFEADGVLTQSQDTLNRYFTSNGDSAFFSFKGVKLMGRVSFDPKSFMPPALSKKFSENDLRLFAETAVLGVKNYPAYALQVTTDPSTGDTLSVRYEIDSAKNFYADISQRIPVMFGFNFPAGKLLDYLTIAFEYFPWQSKNAFYREQGKRIYPLPPLGADTSNYTKTDYLYDSWKWSFNVKKTLTGGLSLIGQLARDHMRHEFWQETQRDDEEIYTRSNEWYWIMRLQYDF